MIVKKKAATKKVAGLKRGPKVKEDKKRPVQVYMLESQIKAMGKSINPKAKTYTDCIEAVREHVLGFLNDHPALEE